MKKLIICIALLSMILAAGVAQASYSYTLDINIPQQAAVNSAGIGMIEFIVNGGAFNTDWTYQLGNAVPSAGHWIFENFDGGWASIYDNFATPLTESAIAPLGSGKIVTITSNVPLTFSDLAFSDFKSHYLGSNFYSTQGFVPSTVPIPAALYLLGSGLIGLVGLRRRINS
jgi:hypothetical protein